MKPTPQQLETRRKLAAKDPAFARFVPRDTPPAPVPARTALPVVRPPCTFEGPVAEYCKTCDKAKAESRHVRQCGHPTADRDFCTRGVVDKGTYQSCVTCPDYRRDYGVRGSPPGHKVDLTKLVLGEAGAAFNASLIRWDGKLLMAYRTGWAGSRIHVAELAEDLTPLNVTTVEGLRRGESSYGCEDPRLFVHRGRLHLSYIGVQGVGKGKVRTHQLYARLRDDLSTEAAFAPRFAGQSPTEWQKNWQFFDHAGVLYAVYSVAPHRVLRVEGDLAEWAHQTPSPVPWTGGELRGGTAPVLVGDEFWSFFHDRIDVHGLRIYRAGVYTFDAAPPFRIRRFCPEPVLTADPDTKPNGQYAAVMFPGGAVLDGDDWRVACGVHDRWIEVFGLKKSDLERRLKIVAPPGWWKMNEGGSDPGIFTHVVGLDEYRLDKLDLKEAYCLDVGAHVGSFAYAAVTRGAAAVDCYEPYPFAARRLEVNAAHMPGVRIVQAGVARTRGMGRYQLRADQPRNEGAGEVIPDTAGTVVMLTLDDVILELAYRNPAGRVNLLKLDCEGGEWPALGGATQLDLVDRVVGEWHPPGGPADLERLLSPFGFTVECVPTEDGRGLFFASRV